MHVRLSTAGDVADSPVNADGARIVDNPWAVYESWSANAAVIRFLGFLCTQDMCVMLTVLLA